MLKQRIITAIVLLPLIILGIIKLPHQYFAYAVAAVFLIGAWEWSGISMLKSTLARIGYVVAIAVVFFILSILAHEFESFRHWSVYFLAIWWIFALLMIARFNSRPSLRYRKTTTMLLGVLLLSSPFVALTALRSSTENGYLLVLVLFVLIWVADTGAYFTGKTIGRHKLAANVSPGKTIEGVIGALVSVICVAVILGYFNHMTYIKIFLFTLISVITAASSVLGDLFVSMFKRIAGLKDAGKILPGHGGILDRLDSMASAAPFFLSGLMLARLP